MTYASGASVSPSTKPMPGTVAMLSGAAVRPNSCMNKILITPMRGWSRNTQPIALRNVGKRIPRSEERRVGKGRRTRLAAEQAEDGIRDWSVTGVQTCALPIYDIRERREREPFDEADAGDGSDVERRGRQTEQLHE